MFDLGSYGLSYAVWPHTARLADFARPDNAPPNADRPIVAQPPGDSADDLKVGNRLLLAGFRRADGYVGLVPRRRLDYRDESALRVAGVGFVADRTGPDDSDSIGWLPVPDPLPTIRLITRAITDHGGAFPSEALAVDAALVDPGMHETESDNPRSDDAPLELPPGRPGTISDLDQRAGRLSVTTATASRQLLVVAASFNSGWQATVDGRPVLVLRVNRDFLGCVVEPGKHRVTLDFHPFSLQVGRVLSSLGLGLLCVQLVVASWLGRRSAPRTVAPERVATEADVATVSLR